MQSFHGLCALTFILGVCFEVWFPTIHLFPPFPLSVLLIYVQSFHGLCALTFIFGVCYEAWFAIIWVLIYDLFPVKIAPDVSGLLGTCWGTALLVVPIFQTLILSTASTTTTTSTAVTPATSLTYSSSHTDVASTAASLTTSSHLDQSSTENETMFQLDQNGISRSFGNQMVMVLLCVFLAVASLTQFFMYFTVIRPKSNLMEKVVINNDEKTNGKRNTNAHSNDAFE